MIIASLSLLKLTGLGYHILRVKPKGEMLINVILHKWVLNKYNISTSAISHLEVPRPPALCL